MRRGFRRQSVYVIKRLPVDGKDGITAEIRLFYPHGEEHTAYRAVSAAMLEARMELIRNRQAEREAQGDQVPGPAQ